MARLSLRWRVAVAFGLSSLLVASLFAVVTWQLASNYMLAQREQSTTAQAVVNERIVEQTLRVKNEGLDELLTGLAGDPRSTTLLYDQGRWIVSGRQVNPAVLPVQLLERARKGGVVRERLVVGDIPVLAVALPVGTNGDVYIELFPLVELASSFRFLSRVLIAGTVLSALLGTALGWWASRRALRPLTELTAAAARVAQGDLQARLPAQSDPDLAPLATTFNATACALEQRVRRDARFAGDVSHELRSPLTTMVNASAFGIANPWFFTTDRLWLNILPGIAVALGGLMLGSSTSRGNSAWGAWLALLGGIWFTIGPVLAQLWNAGGTSVSIGEPLGATPMQALEQLGYFHGLGALVIALAAFTLGRLSLRSI